MTTPPGYPTNPPPFGYGAAPTGPPAAPQWAAAPPSYPAPAYGVPPQPQQHPQQHPQPQPHAQPPMAYAPPYSPPPLGFGAPLVNPHDGAAAAWGWLTFAIGILAGIPAIVFGVRSRAYARDTGAPSKWGTFALVMGVLSTGVTALFLLIFLLAFASDPEAFSDGFEEGYNGGSSYTATDLEDDLTDAIVEDEGFTPDDVTCDRIDDPDSGTVDCRVYEDGTTQDVRVTLSEETFEYVLLG